MPKMSFSSLLYSDWGSPSEGPWVILFVAFFYVVDIIGFIFFIFFFVKNIKIACFLIRFIIGI